MPINGAQLPQHILFIFLDGIGLGDYNKETNPFITFDLPHFNAIANNEPWSRSLTPIHSHSHVFTSLDATLGIEGLPQSGTGQATLFTGINCAAIAGKHFGPFPHSKTKPTIAESSIFQQVNQLQLAHPEPAAFANAYPPQFFEAAEARNRWTVTTLSCMEAQVKIRTMDELKLNNALTADITRSAWRSHLSIPIDPIDEADAAHHLHEISTTHPFTLYEYYLTDKAGHSQSFAKAKHVLTALDKLIGTLLRIINFEKTLLLITSDHGNLEDLSTKTHTFNEVPLVAYGKGAHFFNDLTSLTEVTPAIISALQVTDKAPRLKLQEVYYRYFFMYYFSCCQNVRILSLFDFYTSVKALLLKSALLLFFAAPVHGQQGTQNQQEKELRAQQLMVQAMTQSFLGYHDKAIPILEEALKLTPSSATINSALAESHEYLGDFSSALFYANQALILDQNEIHFHRHLVHLNIQADDIEMAEGLLIDLLTQFPTDSPSIEDLVEIQSLLDKPEEALQTQERLIAINGPQRTNLEVKLHFLKVLQKWDDYESTLLELEQIAPQYIAYKQELALFYVSQDRPEDAILKLKAALQITPSDPSLTSMLARLYESTGKAQEAESLYQSQQSDDISDPDAAYQRAFQLVNSQPADSSSILSAQRLLSKILDHSPDHTEANTLLGTLLYESGQFKEAAPLLQTAVELNPRAQDTWLLAIEATYNAYDYQQARFLAEDALLLFPGQLPFLSLSAQAHIKLTNYESALSQLDEFLDMLNRNTTLSQDELPRLKAEALATLGLVYDYLQQPTVSDSLYASAISLAPDNPVVHSTMAFGMAEQVRRLDDALQLAQKAIDVDSESTKYMDLIGRVYFRMNNLQEAERWFQKSIQLQNVTPYTYEYMGDLLVEQGKTTEAIASWTKSLELYPNNPVTIEKLRTHSNKP